MEKISEKIRNHSHWVTLFLFWRTVLVKETCCTEWFGQVVGSPDFTPSMAVGQLLRGQCSVFFILSLRDKLFPFGGKMADITDA